MVGQASNEFSAVTDLPGGKVGQTNEDLEWAKNDSSVRDQFPGRWVVPFGRKIVTFGDSLTRVLEVAQERTGIFRKELRAVLVPDPQRRGPPPDDCDYSSDAWIDY